jgi:hypothetical protein
LFCVDVWWVGCVDGCADVFLICLVVCGCGGCNIQSMVF